MPNSPHQVGFRRDAQPLDFVANCRTCKSRFWIWKI